VAWWEANKNSRHLNQRFYDVQVLEQGKLLNLVKRYEGLKDPCNILSRNNMWTWICLHNDKSSVFFEFSWIARLFVYWMTKPFKCISIIFKIVLISLKCWWYNLSFFKIEFGVNYFLCLLYHSFAWSHGLSCRNAINYIYWIFQDVFSFLN
jgi:hypothetical protein